MFIDDTKSKSLDKNIFSISFYARIFSSWAARYNALARGTHRANFL